MFELIVNRDLVERRVRGQFEAASGPVEGGAGRSTPLRTTSARVVRRLESARAAFAAPAVRRSSASHCR